MRALSAESVEDETSAIGQTDEINAIFGMLKSDTRSAEAAEYNELMGFGNSVQRVRDQVAKAGGAKIMPPLVDEVWAHPETVKDANERLQMFAAFAHTRGDMLNALTQEVASGNADLVRHLELFFGDPPAGDEQAADP